MHHNDSLQNGSIPEPQYAKGNADVCIKPDALKNARRRGGDCDFGDRGLPPIAILAEPSTALTRSVRVPLCTSED